MKSNKAIDILTEQRGKLTDKIFYKDENWALQTASYIKEFFGEQSPEYSFISQFTFTVLGNIEMSKEQWRLELDWKKKKALQYIDNCIETIRHKGLYKPPKSNFLQRYNDTWLSAILLSVASAIATVSFITGQNSADIKNIELRQELKHIRDSLNVTSPTTLNNSSENISHKDTSIINTNIKKY